MFGMDLHSLLITLSIVAIPGIFAITLHEVSHGWAAKRLGDPTAAKLGRLTINPIKHIDPLGTIVVPLATLLLLPGGMVFGWAKPVPVVSQNLGNPQRDLALVAAAGPASNLLMAIVWALVGKVVTSQFGMSGPVNEWVLGACVFGMQINVVLAILNLLPIPPLDGGKVLAGFLPALAAKVLERIEPFGLIIVILLMASRVLGAILERPVNSLLAFYHSVAGLA